MPGFLLPAVSHEHIIPLMNIRNAQVDDVNVIHELISEYAQRERMLFRPPADIYENLQTFRVAEDAGRAIGCCALGVIWKDLAEIKSLAVDQVYKGRGVGRALVQDAVKQARLYGISRVFALTLEPVFFEKLGFNRLEKEQLPMKVWSDCARCSKQDQCDEIALIIETGP